MAIVRDLIRQEKAQGLVEYILIVALIALVAIGAVRLFGGKIASWFQGSADKLEQEMNSENGDPNQ